MICTLSVLCCPSSLKHWRDIPAMLMRADADELAATAEMPHPVCRLLREMPELQENAWRT
jgi:hypothetical protein